MRTRSDIEVKNKGLNVLFKELGEVDAIRFLSQIRYEKKGNLIKTGKHGPFKPFNAIKMKGKGLTASERVIQDRL